MTWTLLKKNKSCANRFWLLARSTLWKQLCASYISAILTRILIAKLHLSPSATHQTCSSTWVSETKGIRPQINEAVFHFRGMWTETKKGRRPNYHHWTCSCVWSSNEKHWAGTRGGGRSLRTGISQKLSHERQTWNQCRKITRKLVKSFICWVKTRMVEKHAHQHVCQLHPVDPENELSARKKKVSPHFSRIQSQCLQPKACRRLSGSIRNFPVGLQETRCLKQWPPKMAERNRCSFKGHRWVWEGVYLIGR